MILSVGDSGQERRRTTTDKAGAAPSIDIIHDDLNDEENNDDTVFVESIEYESGESIGKLKVHFRIEKIWNPNRMNF